MLHSDLLPGNAAQSLYEMWRCRGSHLTSSPHSHRATPVLLISPGFDVYPSRGFCGIKKAKSSASGRLTNARDLSGFRRVTMYPFSHLGLVV